MAIVSSNPSRSQTKIGGPRIAEAVASDWTPFIKNTLRGFFSLRLPSGLIVHGLTLHEKGGSRWVGMPGRPYTKPDGSTSYSCIIEFADRTASDRFRDVAIDALKRIGAIE